MEHSEPSPASPTLADFMPLFLRHETALRAYARAILPDWGSVDDALQEASVTMLEKFEQLHTVDGFLPWAKVILRFKCFAVAAANRRHRPILSEEVLRLIADEAEPLSQQTLFDSRAALDACMQRFSDAHQTLLLAPYAGDGEVKRTAEQAGKTANALYKLIGRLREKLSECVEVKLQQEMT
ncbi:RNA polymerase factor sigma-70 [Rhodopirellula sp. SWK7]|uniref:RNA polymerase factor sigma-70 n=1 Tax=Rhodopirellula sp. SWK7 TaxID=595460 RepID=UPI0002BFAAC5|nr:RNA polymerase factor sigma-70 [Rhodopirellula sp. SWK7]EMI46977.1 ECF subfamily RNA polymerase sigma factor [Rhodopirellula sp. SWK7]